MLSSESIRCELLKQMYIFGDSCHSNTLGFRSVLDPVKDLTVVSSIDRASAGNSSDDLGKSHNNECACQAPLETDYSVV